MPKTFYSAVETFLIAIITFCLTIPGFVISFPILFIELIAVQMKHSCAFRYFLQFEKYRNIEIFVTKTFDL